MINIQSQRLMHSELHAFDDCIRSCDGCEIVVPVRNVAKLVENLPKVTLRVMLTNSYWITLTKPATRM